MQEQNLRNHSRYVTGYHYIGSPLLLAILIGSFVNLFRSDAENLYDASLICALAVLSAILGVFVRTFALKAQDRAIHAQENLRHYVLTGRLLPSNLTVLQVVALRFASDAEFPTLAEKAAQEGLSPKRIKQAIANWKADHYRV